MNAPPTTIKWEIRDMGGRHIATHTRTDPGKRIAWWLPGATKPGLKGRRTDSMPLYRSELVPGWDTDTWLVVTEGERDCDALAAIGVPALATVTGATRTGDTFSAPTVDALRDVARGRRFILWPDNDPVGRGHMSAVAANLYRAGARSVFTMAYSPSVAHWPEGAGARDLIGAAEPIQGAAMVSWMVEEWAERILRLGPVRPARSAPTRAPRDTGSVSDALIARGVIKARPGRTVRCPAHDDKHASLSILKDDMRAVCKSASCPWSGRGVIAADIAGMVSA